MIILYFSIILCIYIRDSLVYVRTKNALLYGLDNGNIFRFHHTNRQQLTIIFDDNTPRDVSIAYVKSIHFWTSVIAN